MITADGRVDHDRISDIAIPSVTEAVNQSFGVGFFDSSTDQKLLLIEVLAFTLRDGGSFRENLLAVASGGCPVVVPDISSTSALEVNEGLKLLALLHESIVEDYSVAKHRQQRETIDDYAGEDTLDRYKNPAEY
jgi:hypothetical protein